MNNTKEILEVNKIKEQLNNEEQEVKINIDVLLPNEVADRRNISRENNERSNKNDRPLESSYDLDKEVQNIIETANRAGQQYTVLDVTGNHRKSATWVQYNQSYGNQESRGPHYQGGGGGGGGFDYDPESRNYFVKFVFTILLIMLIITAAYGAAVLLIPELKEIYRTSGPILLLASMVVMIAMSYVMACSPCARVPPCNFISLLIVVVAMSNLVGAVTIRYRTDIIMYALTATIVTVAVCILLACTSFDFTKWYIYVVVISVVFVVITMAISIAMLAMGTRYKPLMIVILFVGAMMNVVLIIIELQIILGGKSLEIGEDDYALAAYMLYTSIVNLFLDILQLLGLMESD